MLSFIEELQKKPEHERRRIHIATTISLTLIIVAVWFTTFFDTGHREVIVDHRGNSPISRMTGSVGDAAGRVGGFFSDIGDFVVKVRDNWF